MSRSKRLPFVATRIVYACSALTMTERALWCQHYGLDNNADGCILGASSMARRLAISRDWVEQLRRRFLDLGLLRKRDRGLGRHASWYVTLPASCKPRYDRMTDEDVEVFAERLAAHVGMVGPKRRAPPEGDKVLPPERPTGPVRQPGPGSGAPMTAPLTHENRESHEAPTTPVRRTDYSATFPAEAESTSGKAGESRHRNYNYSIRGAHGDPRAEEKGKRKHEDAGPGLEPDIPLPERPALSNGSHRSEPVLGAPVARTFRFRAKRPAAFGDGEEALEGHLRELVRGRPDLDRDQMLAQVPFSAQGRAGKILDALLANAKGLGGARS